MPSIVTIHPDRREDWQALLQRAFSKRWGREYYQMEGIGHVATDVRFQGRGYGTVLLRSYLEGKGDWDATLVYAREGAFYRKLGWRRLVHHTLIVRRRAVSDRASSGALRRRRATRPDLPALARLYDAFNREEGLPHVARSPAYWAKWVAWKLRVYRLSADLFLAGARPVGYMFSRRFGRRLVIEEYGALPSARGGVYAAMHAAFSGARGAATLQLMRPTRSLEAYLNAIGVEHESRRAPHDTGHAIVHHPALRAWSRRLGIWHVDHF